MKVRLTLTGETIEVTYQDYVDLLANGMVIDERVGTSPGGLDIPDQSSLSLPVDGRGQDGSTGQDGVTG